VIHVVGRNGLFSTVFLLHRVDTRVEPAHDGGGAINHHRTIFITGRDPVIHVVGRNGLFSKVFLLHHVDTQVESAHDGGE